MRKFMLTITLLAAMLFSLVSVGSASGSVAKTIGSESVATVDGITPFALCNVNKNTWVREFAGLNTRVLYTIPRGGGFRAVSGPVVADGIAWMKGHGNGGATGWVPAGNLINCH